MKDNNDNINTVVSKIEAILFYLNEPVSVKELNSYLQSSEQEVLSALEILKEKLSGGVVLVINNNEVSLGTNPQFSDLIEKISREELNKDLSQASLDTLSIILYKSPITKKEIEYIRGVNSSFSIRNLLMRGLVTRESSKLDERIHLYRPTTELFSYLGITKIEEMPEWENLQKELNLLKEDNATEDLKVEDDNQDQ